MGGRGNIFAWLWMLGFLVSIGAGYGAQAADPSEKERKPSAPRFQRLEAGEGPIRWDKLELTNAQKQQFVAKRREFQVETAGMRQELELLQRDLRAEIAEQPVDRAAMTELLDSITTVKLQLSEAAVRNVLSLKALLTPEQRDMLREMQRRLPPGFQSLDLTAEQQARVADTMRAAFRQDRELAAQVDGLRAELEELVLLAEEDDQERIFEVQRAITRLEMAQETSRIEVFLRMRDVLTPEQFERYKKFRERRPPEGESGPPDK